MSKHDGEFLDGESDVDLFAQTRGPDGRYVREDLIDDGDGQDLL